MKTKPTVSVITSLYNAESYIADTIRSVVAQTFPEWEMIIVDDCSTDTSVEIARVFASRDNRIKVRQLDRNRGPAVSRNTAIEAATGRYIAFLDSDDKWLPEKLEKQVAFMRSRACAFSHTYYARITESGERIGRAVMPPDQLSYRDMLKSNRIGCLSAVYDSKKLGKVYMPDIRKRQDYGLWLGLLKRENFAYCLQEILALYRVRSGSTSSNKLDLVRYNWRLFRDVEKLPIPQCLYYLTWNIGRKIAH